MGKNIVLRFAAVMAFISVLEVALVFSGLLPPVLSYSAGNLVFSLARFAVIAFVAYSRTKKGLFDAAKTGATLSFASVLVICLAALASRLWVKIPLLGISVQSETALFQVLAFILIENVVIGAAVAAIIAAIAVKIKK